jgi:acyl-CoA thioesterase-1
VELARQYKTALLPYLFEGFGEKLELFQPDRIHPTETAQPAVLKNVMRALGPLLKKK